MKRFTCVIVGGNGFVGRHLCREHAHRDHDVLAFDAQASASDDTTPHVAKSLDVLEQAPPIPPSCDVVYYLAQSPHYRDFPAHADHLFGVNALGALRTAMAARSAGARRFIYASTGNVYAPTFEPMREESPVRRDDAYALSKLAGEEMLAVVPDLEITRIRLFGVFGPGQRVGLAPAIAERVRQDDAVTLAAHPLDAADADGLRISLTFVDDVVGMLADLTARDDRLPDVLNLAARRPVSIRRLATALGETMGNTPRFSPAPARTTDFIADVGRLETLVALRETPMKTALSRTFGDSSRVPVS